VALPLLLLAANPAYPEPDPPMEVRTATFDRDPGWEGRNNRIVPRKFPTVTQDFGFSGTRHAAQAPGEIGGQVWRSTTPAYYAAQIPPKTLNDALSTAGTFALTASSNSSGLFFGWFQGRQPGGGRPISSLGWYLDGERTGARLSVAAVTGTNRAHGRFVTPFEPRKGIKPTPIHADGTRHTFRLTYDPAAHDGQGRITFALDGGKPLVADLPPGFRRDNARFDHFGLMNTHKAGHPLTAYVGDLYRDGVGQDLTQDPHWEGAGNRASFQDREVTGAHDFGFSPTHFAG
jgi:hypothetical protein